MLVKIFSMFFCVSKYVSVVFQFPIYVKFKSGVFSENNPFWLELDRKLIATKKDLIFPKAFLISGNQNKLDIYFVFFTQSFFIPDIIVESHLLSFIY